MVAYSDSVIATYWEAGDEAILVNRLADLLREVFVSALKSGIALRGAVSWGSFYQAESVILGPAIDEAADWSDAANWVGVILTPSAGEIVERVTKGNEGLVSGRFKRWEVAVSQYGPAPVWALWWPREGLRPLLEALVPQPPVSVGAGTKWANTLQFYDDLILEDRRESWPLS